MPATIVVLTLWMAGAPAPAVAAGPPQDQQGSAAQEWEQVGQAAVALVLDGKTTEAVALVQEFLTRHPAMPEAHFVLAGYYEELAGFGELTPDQRGHLESAVRHYVRAAELLTDETARFVTLWKLSMLHSDRLNQPLEAERFARRMVEVSPGRPEAHVTYARLLHARGDVAAAAEAMRAGRVLAPEMPAPGLLLLEQYLLERVQSSPELPRETIRALLDEAIEVADAIVADPQRAEIDYRLATMSKAMALELLAERVEQDRARRIALLAEAERFGAPIEEHVNGAPPVRPELTPERGAALEWTFIDRLAARLAGEGRFSESLAAYEAYRADRPDFHEIHARIADVHLQWADAGQDETTRTRLLETAVGQFQRAIDLAPDVDARDLVFVRMLDVLGPTQLDRPDRAEAAIRAMVAGHPTSPRGQAALVVLLYRSGRGDEAGQAWREARAVVPATAAARSTMAQALLSLLIPGRPLTPDTARAVFDMAGEAIAEAETADPNSPDVLEARGGWLSIQAERFEPDPSRAAALAEQARRLFDRAFELRQKRG